MDTLPPELQDAPNADIENRTVTMGRITLILLAAFLVAIFGGEEGSTLAATRIPLALCIMVTGIYMISLSNKRFSPIPLDEWKAFAQEHRLKISPGKTSRDIMTCEGIIDDVHIKIFSTTETRSEGGPTTTYSLQTQPQIPFSKPFRLRPPDTFKGLSNVLQSTPDLQTGEALFDAQFSIRSEYPKETLSLLTAETRAELLKLNTLSPGFTLDQHTLLLSQKEPFTKRTRLNALLQSAIRAIHALNDASVHQHL